MTLTNGMQLTPRNRLMLELMARRGMRVGEVLKLKGRGVNDRNLSINK
jgi:site-specific recombinase XerD